MRIPGGGSFPTEREPASQLHRGGREPGDASSVDESAGALIREAWRRGRRLRARGGGAALVAGIGLVVSEHAFVRISGRRSGERVS